MWRGPYAGEIKCQRHVSFNSVRGFPNEDVPSPCNYIPLLLTGIQLRRQKNLRSYLSYSFKRTNIINYTELVGLWNFSIVRCFWWVETRRFGNWMFPSSGEGRGEDTQWLKLDLSKEPNWGVFSLPLSPKDGNRSSFRNVVFLLHKTPDDGKSPKSQ
jgi:hypothetical protein